MNQKFTNKEKDKKKRKSGKQREINTHKTKERIHACEQTLAEIQTHTEAHPPRKRLWCQDPLGGQTEHDFQHNMMLCGSPLKKRCSQAVFTVTFV